MSDGDYRASPLLAWVPWLLFAVGIGMLLAALWAVGAV